MAAPNLLSATTINGKTSVINGIGSTATTILSNSASSGKVLKVNAIVVSNTDSADRTLTTDFYRNSIAYDLITNVTIAQKSAFTPVDKTMTLYLEEGDSIRLTSGSSDSGYLDAICSYEDIS